MFCVISNLLHIIMNYSLFDLFINCFFFFLSFITYWNFFIPCDGEKWKENGDCDKLRINKSLPQSRNHYSLNVCMEPNHPHNLYMQRFHLDLRHLVSFHPVYPFNNNKLLLLTHYYDLWQIIIKGKINWILFF